MTTPRLPILPPGPIVETDLSEDRPALLPPGYYPPRLRPLLRAVLAASVAFVALAIGLTTAGVVLAARAGEPTATRAP